MNTNKRTLLGAAALIVSASGAMAADLPTRKAAPVAYVKICDAYGAGFFFIPGTDTCLRVGGLAMAEWDVASVTPGVVSTAPSQPVGTLAGYNAFLTNPIGGITNIPGVVGSIPMFYGPIGWRSPQTRDAVSSATLGRIELDTRTQTDWGTVRTFMRIESYFGSGAPLNTGSLATLSTAGTYYLSGMLPSRETVLLNKLYIQWAGITMGRIQSMFDFYADAVGYQAVRGSNGTVNAIAYTYTAGGGFSATLSLEDSPSRRAAPYNTVTFGSVTAAGIANNPWIAGTPTATLNGTRVPEIVGALRVDQPWGAAQLSGALHPVRAGLNALGLTFNGNGDASAAGNFTINGGFQPIQTNTFGFALQAGVMFKLDQWLSQGDVLWLQAVYGKGAIGYVGGSNMLFASNSPNNLTAYGTALRLAGGQGWNTAYGDTDCVFTYSGRCELSSAFAVTSALRHYWTPTISSTLQGSYYSVTYPQSAQNPAIGSAFVNTGTVNFLYGIQNFREVILATGIEWNPIRGFGIGAEVSVQHDIVGRSIGLAPDSNLASIGLPTFRSVNDLLRARIRMYRVF